MIGRTLSVVSSPMSEKEAEEGVRRDEPSAVIRTTDNGERTTLYRVLLLCHFVPTCLRAFLPLRPYPCGPALTCHRWEPIVVRNVTQEHWPHRFVLGEPQLDPGESSGRSRLLSIPIPVDRSFGRR